MEQEKKQCGRAVALLPVGIFLVLYLGLGILFEYILQIPMGFYKIPIVVVCLAALLVACLQNRSLPFDRKLEIMAAGVGDKNILTMILIFLTSGVFVGVTGRSSAEAVSTAHKYGVISSRVTSPSSAPRTKALYTSILARMPHSSPRDGLAIRWISPT